jgi:hypothetical protein
MSSVAPKQIVVNAKVELTVIPAEFQPSANLELIDVNKIRSRKKIEVGEFIGGCCATKVYGVVQRGMVTTVELAKCKDMKSPPSWLAPTVAKALKAAEPGRGGKFKPMPVADFIAQARNRFIDIDWGGGCIYICIGPPSDDHCYFCCLADGLFCGKSIVVLG